MTERLSAEEQRIMNDCLHCGQDLQLSHGAKEEIHAARREQMEEDCKAACFSCETASQPGRETGYPPIKEMKSDWVHRFAIGPRRCEASPIRARFEYAEREKLLNES